MNKKLLLVYDEYSEMMRNQTELMKIGFDIKGIVNEALLLDQLLVFNPDVVVTAGKGGKVSAPSVAQKLKEQSRYPGKVLVLLPPSQRPSVDELSRLRMDAMAEFPCPIAKLISIVAKLSGLDADQLMEKYRRARLTEGASPKEIAALRVHRDRASRFERASKGVEMDVHKTTFDRGAIKARQDDLKKDWDDKKLAEIDQEKIRFAEALFKKK